MQRMGQDNVVGQRAARKLAGVASTLENWANFLDFRAAGNAAAANDILRRLSSDTSQVPIMTFPDIQEHFIQGEGANLTMRDALERVLGPVKTPDDLPGALDRIQRLGGALSGSQIQTLQFEKAKIQMLQEAWASFKNGDEDGAVKLIDKVGRSGGLEDANPYYERIKAGMVEPIVISRLKKWTDLQPTSHEDPARFVERVLDALYEKGDYPAISEVMGLGEQLLRISARNPTLIQDRAMIDRYLAAQRFESVGDNLSAVTEYRNVLGGTGGKFAPTKQSGEALQRLREKHPDVFKDYEGAVLVELRALRQQVQFLTNRPFPGQMPPPFGR